MSDDKNEIILDPKRCIYVKSDDNSKIYFSNYYLNKLFKKDFVKDNPIKIKFSEDNFMNDSIIPASDKGLVATAKTNIPNSFAGNIPKINGALDILKYSKITYTPNDSNGSAVLDTTIEESEILKSLSKPITIDGKEVKIFTNIEQLRQYLKYDGLWYRSPPKKYTFDERGQTQPVKAEEEQEAVGGGKKTTARRRGKTGHNKHRKSNRRR